MKKVITRLIPIILILGIIFTNISYAADDFDVFDFAEIGIQFAGGGVVRFNYLGN